ncbi:unnamed protein product [Caenorhabditis bovis]|uniref:Transmembrane protein family 132 middle domain-containing protein n=1 Tax=Caenorhabditis bovis TaxID=2654633 RepID=A0A8S1EMM6_9PELO|nr:unnamed protein product [Caenorhabditis bovis]
MNVVQKLYSIGCAHIAFYPPNEAFLLYHGHQNTNFTSVFVQDGCPDSRNLKATVYSADQFDSRRIFEEVPLHCAARVRIITEKVDLERPYVDVLGVLDEHLASHVSNVCIHVQITSSTSANELGKCVLNSREETKTNCVVRVPVPFSWFPDTANKTNVLSVSYTVSEKCDQRFHDLPQHLIEVSSRVPKQNVQILANSSEEHIQVAVRSTANQSFSQNSVQSLFVHVDGSNITNPIEIRLWIDSRVTIESVYPTSPNWTIRVSSASRPLFYTSLFCTPKQYMTSFNANIIALLIKMTSASEIIKDDVILHWHVLFAMSADDVDEKKHKVATKFGVVHDEIAAVVVVPKRTELMNIAVISGQQVMALMRIFTVSIGAKAEDVTASSHCISSDAKILKTSPTCTSVYVDGSETSGSAEVLIYAHFQRYTTSFPFRIWYPRLPLTVRVLASLSIFDEKTEEQLYLSSHKKILFDVTNVVHNTLQVVNRTVATIRFIDGQAQLIGENIGTTRVLIRNVKLANDLASESILVHSDEVAISGLSARPICRLHIRILPILFSPAFFKIETTFSTIITRLYQQCSVDCTVSYSDGNWETLAHIDSEYFNVAAHSHDDRSLAVSHHSANIHAIAIDDRRPLPSIEISLNPSAQCSSAVNLMAPLAATILTVPIHVNSSKSVIVEIESSTFSIESDVNESLPAVPMHLFLLTILALIFIFILITIIRRSAAFKGYEQLVAPLLSRLSSSSSSTRHEDTNEWVWLSQPQMPSSTLSSDYSDKSTSYKRQSSSFDDPTRASISYHGSEISVFLAPSSANVMVNQHRSRHALVDSNSDHNLARVMPKDDKWQGDQYRTWTWKKRDRLSAPIRESVA